MVDRQSWGSTAGGAHAGRSVRVNTGFKLDFKTGFELGFELGFRKAATYANTTMTENNHKG